jgi:hypothetical protein
VVGKAIITASIKVIKRPIYINAEQFGGTISAYKALILSKACCVLFFFLPGSTLPSANRPSHMQTVKALRQGI